MWVVLRNAETGFKKRQSQDEFKKVSKFMESAWKLTYYTTSVCLAIFISRGEPWVGNTDAFWHGWPYQTLKYVSLWTSGLIDLGDLCLSGMDYIGILDLLCGNAFFQLLARKAFCYCSAVSDLSRNNLQCNLVVRPVCMDHWFVCIFVNRGIPRVNK